MRWRIFRYEETTEARFSISTSVKERAREKLTQKARERGTRDNISIRCTYTYLVFIILYYTHTREKDCLEFLLRVRYVDIHT